MRLVVLCLVLGACSGGDALCEPPAVTTYDCQPVPAGSSGCVGGPVWSPIESGSDGPRYQDDVGTTFPAQCFAEIPDCSPYHMGRPREFMCQNGAWIEGL